MFGRDVGATRGGRVGMAVPGISVEPLRVGRWAGQKAEW